MSSIVLVMPVGCIQHDYGLPTAQTGGANSSIATAGSAGHDPWIGQGGGGSAVAGGVGRGGGGNTNSAVSGAGQGGGASGPVSGNGHGGDRVLSLGGTAGYAEGGTTGVETSLGASASMAGATDIETSAGGITGASTVVSAGGSSSLGGAISSGGIANSGGVQHTGGQLGASTFGGTSGMGGAFGGTGAATVGGAVAGASGSIVIAAGGHSAAGAGGTTPTGGTGSMSGSAGLTSTAGSASDEPPSCRGLTTTCQGESCCTTIHMDANETFRMGRSTDSLATDYYPDADATSKDEIPEHDALVGPFSLDKYEVTVGRFRKFVKAYDAWHAATSASPNPQADQGQNPNVDASIRALTGWNKTWNSLNFLPTNEVALRAELNGDVEYQTWTDEPTGHEVSPINYVTWYVAFAFCIWDNARLPTEAEWEYAASGGEERLFPWIGRQVPLPANYFASKPTSPLIDVGTYNGGKGRFGHLDLAGSMWEWVFDWWDPNFYGPLSTPSDCNNCVSTSQTASRAKRGGAWDSSEIFLRAASRGGSAPDAKQWSIGLRCAR